MEQNIRAIESQPDIQAKQFLKEYSPLKKYANECIAKYIVAGFQSSKTCMFCDKNKTLISEAVRANPTTKDGRTKIHKLLQAAQKQAASQDICTAHTNEIRMICSGMPVPQTSGVPGTSGVSVTSDVPVTSGVPENIGGCDLDDSLFQSDNEQELLKLKTELENIISWKDQLSIAKNDLTDLIKLLQSMCSILNHGDLMPEQPSIDTNETKTCQWICKITHTYIRTQQLLLPINEMISREIEQKMIEPIKAVLKENFNEPKCDIEDGELFAISIQCLKSGDQDKNIIMCLQSIGLLEISKLI